MGYLVLARKHRPDRFDQVVGQEAVTRTLRNALETGRVAHAYLFTGPRGVGKTSIARILARALQCEQGPTADPCGECDRCRGVRDGSDLDVIEIDGASNRGIENIRDLRESVRYAPASGRSKVYIVDEVHQITVDAFNAFLKTLEEPPEHVVFVFATTEPSKVPETIRSRCQEFEFRRIPDARIAEQIRAIGEAEDLELEPGMDEEIARRARGGLRDALSLLDQLSAYGAGKVSFAAFRELTGFLDPSRIAELFDALVESRLGDALDWVAQAQGHGASAGDLLDQLLHHTRVLLHLGAGSPRSPSLPGVEPERLKGQFERCDQGQLLAMMQALAHGRRQLREFEDSSLILEMVVLELAQILVLPQWSELLSGGGSARAVAKPERTPTSAPSAEPKSSDAPSVRRGADRPSGGKASARSDSERAPAPEPQRVARGDSALQLECRGRRRASAPAVDSFGGRAMGGPVASGSWASALATGDVAPASSFAHRGWDGLGDGFRWHRGARAGPHASGPAGAGDHAQALGDGVRSAATPGRQVDEGAAAATAGAG